MINYRFFLVALVSFIVYSCAPASLEEYSFEGEEIAKELLKDLVEVHSSGDLLTASSRLKKRFASLVELMIAAKKHEKKYEETPVISKDQFLSDALKAEFIRIYQIDGCKEIMEGIQRESLHKLDLFNQTTKIYRNETLR